mmetsp:Transcript_7744/g.21978  ORF Transcript_7744/g.21978 Transcript_7744/m.21978 type:complete len:239 (-) Transcript_7744:870-1586(-)
MIVTRSWAVECRVTKNLVVFRASEPSPAGEPLSKSRWLPRVMCRRSRTFQGFSEGSPAKSTELMRPQCKKLAIDGTECSRPGLTWARYSGWKGQCSCARVVSRWSWNRSQRSGLAVQYLPKKTERKEESKKRTSALNCSKSRGPRRLKCSSAVTRRWKMVLDGRKSMMFELKRSSQSWRSPSGEKAKSASGLSIAHGNACWRRSWEKSEGSEPRSSSSSMVGTRGRAVLKWSRRGLGD